MAADRTNGTTAPGLAKPASRNHHHEDADESGDERRRRRGHGDVYSHHALSNHDARRVAVVAACDPRGVFKYLHGMPQAATSRERIERGLRECGFAHLIGYATRTAANAAHNARAGGKR